MDSSSPCRVLDTTHSNIAGVKRPAPGPLLPAFEPSSSPPRFKRQKSRVSPDERENRYPTPNPSSSIGLLPSSPPPPIPRRPLLQRTLSQVSERAPLSTVPSITLPENGEPVLLGRSSNSSHYRLSANRLISRVHVKAAYVGTAARPKVEIVCTGWNGVKIHCQGHAWELSKGDVFTSETEHAEIMLDVQDSRVLLAWPGTRSANTSFEGSPVARVSRSPSIGSENEENIDPRRHHARQLANASRDKFSPVSPTPKRTIPSTNPLILPSESMTDTFLEIYEDEPVADFNRERQQSEENDEWGVGETASQLMHASTQDDIDDSSSLSVPDDEEDDAGIITTSFVGQGDEPLLPPMKKFSTLEPLRNMPGTPPSSRRTSVPASSPTASRRNTRTSASISPNKMNTLQNHITNQLAFSRISATPLSDLFTNLPSALANCTTKDHLASVLAEIECIGEVRRQGKDASGKPLESEYYYIPDCDGDEGRRLAVGGRAGLRNCRKTHKQYFWRKPKKPTY